MAVYETLPEDHKRFVDSYIHCLNYRKAYQDAYPLVTDWGSARTQGSRLAANPVVKQAIVEQLKTYSIDKSETLQRIITLIQFDVSDYMTGDDLIVDKLNKAGLGWMIKAIKPTKFGTEYILMDKDRALENLAKIHMLFTDTSTINVNINQEVTAKQQLEDKLRDLDSKLNG